MNIQIKSDDKEQQYAKISFDANGNAYLEYNGVTYQVCVDGKNRPFLDKGDYDIIDISSIKKGKLKLSEHKYSLKGKLLKEKEKEKESKIEDDNSDDDVNDEELNQKYYPEDKEYFEDYSAPKKEPNQDPIDETDKSDDEDDHDTNSEEWKYSITELDIDVSRRKNGDISALYDTIVYNNDIMCFKMSQSSSPAIYRLQIYNSGKCSFRATGDSDNYYNVVLNKDKELVLL